MVEILPYGAWPSPLDAGDIARGGLRLGGVARDAGGSYWIEGRAAEGGRNVLVRRAADGALADLIPAPFDVRTRVHEYGGGAFALDGADVWFVNFADQRIHHLADGAAPRPLTAQSGQRYADLVLDQSRGRLLCVCETHRDDGTEPENSLVAVSLATGGVSTLAAGHDFFSNPTLSADGRRLAWLAWDHPRMPWDGTELWLAELDARGVPRDARRVAGGPEISVYQPTFSPDGRLFHVADPDGWWNLYAWSEDGIRPVAIGERELAHPQWSFGSRAYGFAGDAVVATYCEQGRWRLGVVDAEGGDLRPLDLPFEDIGGFAIHGDRALLLAGAPDRVAAVVEVDLDGGGFEVLRSASSLALSPRAISAPEPITFPTTDGDRAHALYYPPRNPAYAGPPGERPPLVVVGHGGPTGATSATLGPGIQYWTTRGFAVLDVNYRGSTGYGRAYRDRLKGMWGVYDVADCVAGATYLVGRGDVDPARLAIRGGSAGGYTALAALTFHDVFTAGASYYGISELEALARDTHKFESRYLDQLIGPYPAERERYRDRSPIHFTARLSCPVIFFQGLEDQVVPPNQAEMMVEALKSNGLPVAYLAFPGEQHGFRAAATIERTLEAELWFYGRIFGFTPAGDIEPVEIAGL